MEKRRDGNETAVVIIGAGISGMCAAFDMIRQNKSRDFIILEKGTSVGGTWNDNKYPGCCCDIWSHLYSYSFEGNPDWTREYPGQEEIHAYLVGVAQKWGLYQNIRFGTKVDEARWDDSTNTWKIKVQPTGGKDAEYSTGYTISSSFLLSGVGQLNMPHYPEIAGLKSFEGKTMHSARWDWSYDLVGKRIGIIGNGATAAQIIPEITKVASSVTVFQRTPNWIIPRGDKPISNTVRNIYRYVPGTRKLYRRVLMDVRESFYKPLVTQTPELEEWIRQMSLDHLAKQIPDDEELRAKLTPNYSPGCKRIIISDDYFPALTKPHVTLETSPIEAITPSGIKTTDKEYDVDLLVLATGFRTTQFMYPIKIYGVNGRSIEDIWADGARAYLGTTVESLPNFGIFYGPNTNLGHNSIILMIEAQSRYLNTLITPILAARSQNQTLKILPSPIKVKEFNMEIQERLKKTSFADPRCNSWYKNEKGIITNNWCGTVVEFQKRLGSVVWSDFIVEGSGDAACRGKRNIGRVVEEGTISSVVKVLTGALVVGGIVWRLSMR